MELRKQDGIVISKEEEIEEEAVNFFSSLLAPEEGVTSESPSPYWK